MAEDPFILWRLHRAEEDLVEEDFGSPIAELILWRITRQPNQHFNHDSNSRVFKVVC